MIRDAVCFLLLLQVLQSTEYYSCSAANGRGTDNANPT